MTGAGLKLKGLDTNETAAITVTVRVLSSATASRSFKVKAVHPLDDDQRDRVRAIVKRR